MSYVSVRHTTVPPKNSKNFAILKSEKKSTTKPICLQKFDHRILIFGKKIRSFVSKFLLNTSSREPIMSKKYPPIQNVSCCEVLACPKFLLPEKFCTCANTFNYLLLQYCGRFPIVIIANSFFVPLLVSMNASRQKMTQLRYARVVINLCNFPRQISLDISIYKGLYHSSSRCTFNQVSP